MTPTPRRQNTATPSGDSRIPIGAIATEQNTNFLFITNKPAISSTCQTLDKHELAKRRGCRPREGGQTVTEEQTR